MGGGCLDIFLRDVLVYNNSTLSSYFVLLSRSSLHRERRYSREERAGSVGGRSTRSNGSSSADGGSKSKAPSKRVWR